GLISLAVPVAAEVRMAFLDAHIAVAVYRHRLRMAGPVVAKPIARAVIIVRIEVSVTMTVVAEVGLFGPGGGAVVGSPRGGPEAVTTASRGDQSRVEAGP